jgi:hypothetical protein
VELRYASTGYRPARRQARQAKGKRENRYVLKVMRFKQGGGTAEGCSKPFHRAIISYTILFYPIIMQGRFKMEYRLFTIVRYNCKDYKTLAKPNMHARLKTK